jgi:fatty-acyl-CoA synthase
MPERAAVPLRVEIIPQMPMTAVGKIFKPRLRQLAMERVVGELLRASGIDAAVSVRDDRQLGAVVTVTLADDAGRAAATDSLARLPVTLEFAGPARAWGNPAATCEELR